ncbi:MAG: YjbQ family protein [Spirochaetes bacterium]|nr:MAG: YjbQ family protein [Spirochaetota bacterium]
MVFSKEITIETRGFSDVRDITPEVRSIVEQSRITEGIAYVFIPGATASVSTIEYEPALVEDFKEKLEQFAPQTERSRHSQTWGDDNGFSHLRATFMGPGITIPVHRGELVLGTWQQVVVIDHDNRARSRRVFIQVMGE